MQYAGRQFAEFTGLFRRCLSCRTRERQRVFALPFQVWADSQQEQTSALCKRYDMKLADFGTIVSDEDHIPLAAQDGDGFNVWCPGKLIDWQNRLQRVTAIDE